MDLALDRRRELVLRFFEIVVALQSQPEFRRGPEVASERERRVCRNSALALHDFRDPIGRHAQIHREPIDANPGGNDKVLVQYLSRVKRATFSPWQSQFI